MQSLEEEAEILLIVIERMQVLEQDNLIQLMRGMRLSEQGILIA
jgi:hypothetical protein